MSARHDVLAVLADLVAIDSVNPSLVPGGAGEQAISRYISGWLTAAGLEVAFEEVVPGRPNVIATRRGTGGGPTLLLLAHSDTVGVAGMDGPLRPRVADGRMHGRGVYDMKAGLAAAMCAAADVEELAGDVVVAAVCDEEAGGIGTRALLSSGLHIDAAIVTEPTDLAVGIAHKGFVAFEIETAGRAAHGSRPDLGIDAITAMGPVLVELAALDARLQAGPRHPVLGTGSVHASLIEGGQEPSSYPARCLLTGEWRTVPGDDPEPSLLKATGRGGPSAQLRLPYRGAPFATDPASEIVQLVQRHAGTDLVGVAYWADSALLGEAGIPTVLFGPAGGGAHAIDEWADLASVEEVRDVLVNVARSFCSVTGSGDGGAA